MRNWTIVLPLIIACTQTSYVPPPGYTHINYHKNGNAIVAIRSGDKICGGWYSGDNEIITAAHCMNGPFTIAGVDVKRAYLDLEHDIMKLYVDAPPHESLPFGDAETGDVVDVVNPYYGTSVTNVSTVYADDVTLSWTAKPGWSGSPAIKNGKAVCMVVSYYLAGGSRCEKLRF